MIIDFHAHMGRGPEGSTDLLQSNLPPELVVERAREAGIDRTVVFPVTYPEYSGANREIADAVAKYPDDLIGFARLNPNNPTALQNLEAAASLRLRGLKLHHGCDRFELDSAPVHDILDACAGHGWPVVFHSIGVVDTLTALAAAHPQTTIVFGHMGGLWSWKAARACMTAAEEHENVYLETSSMLVSWMIEEAAKRVPDRVLFGSDAPAIHPKVELEKILICKLPREVEEKILGGNAARLLQN
jgi:hypothetical protein